MYAKVYIDTASVSADKIYEYSVPEELCGLIKPMMRVAVYFGNAKTLKKAFVVSLSETTQYDPEKIKPVIRLLDTAPAVTSYLADTVVFLREQYFCTYAEALKVVLPASDKIKRRITYTPCGKPCEEIMRTVQKNITQKSNISPEDAEKVYEALTAKPASGEMYIKNKTSLAAEKLTAILALLVKCGAVVCLEDFTVDNMQRTESYVRLPDEDNPLEDFLMIIGTRAKKQREVMEYMFSIGTAVSVKRLREETGASAQALKALADMQLLIPFEKEKQREGGEPTERTKTHAPLTEEQKSVLNEYAQMKQGEKILLHGVTGSGKTRVFFEMFEECLAKGRQCLLLVPEISLTPQMMRLVKERFGQAAAVVHSKLSQAQRYAEFLKIRSGSAKIVLGARSALFMPFTNLGMIVVDEEHETSYRSSSSPRYDTVEVANFISDRTGATLLLSSATPSVDTYLKATTGVYKLLSLQNRVNNIPLPPVTITDMRMELREGNRTPISRLLQEKISENLLNGKQTLLFLNRRGYNTYVFCRNCGHIEMCPNCEVSLTSHISSSSLTCHYCGYKKALPRVCPECGSDKIKYMGSGTEKIERIVKQMFPDAVTLRLDSDTAAQKDMYEKILGDFAAGRADILIGTQMIVKGLDFDNVTLVGVLLADASLNFPDINASQRTFQLVSQAAGRAGRRGEKAMVVLQTYKPDNPTLIYCANHDYKGFFAYDIDFRRKMDYPPFSELIGLFCAHEDENHAIADAQTLYERTDELIKQKDYGNIKLYEVSAAFIQKLKNKYIYHIIIRYEPESGFKRDLRENYDKIQKNIKSYVYAEINPITLL